MIAKPFEFEQFHDIYIPLYPHLKTGHVVNDPLTPSTVIPSSNNDNEKSLISSDLFKTPIMLLTERNLKGIGDLTLTLETLIRQTGIEPKNVIVFYDRDCCSEVKHLANLFGFMSNEYILATQSPTSREQIFLDALQTTQLLFPEGNQIIIIESHCILSPDFLPFLGLLIPVLMADEDLLAVNVWNDNGFVITASESSLIYRASVKEYPPRFAFMIKRQEWLETLLSVKDEVVQEDGNTKTNQGSLSFEEGGYFDVLFSRKSSNNTEVTMKQVIVPDVSRISLLVSPNEQFEQREGNNEDDGVHTKKAQFLKHYMSHQRLINMREDEESGITKQILANISTSTAYHAMVRLMIESSRHFVNCNESIAFIESITRLDHLHPRQQETSLSLSDYDGTAKPSL